MVHMRHGEGDFYVKLVKKGFHDAEVITVSDFNNVANIWLGDYIYNKKDVKNYFNIEVCEEIRMRCRFLRSIDKVVAYNLINNLALGLDQCFTVNKVDVVIGGLIDCYSQDVLERISKRYDVLYISFVGHFFRGYCRISARGELNKMPRIVSKEEIESVLNQVMLENYKPNFKINRPKSRSYMCYLYGRELAKKYLYFPMKKIKEHDFLNYHYNTTITTGWKISSVISKDITKYFNNLNDLSSQIFCNSILIPLHFNPEATLDYWLDNPRFALHEETVLKIVTQTPNHIKLLVKEHPAMYLRRSIDFYEKLKSFNNVTIIHPYECCNRILNKVDNVLVFTGSVGVEALLRNKRVLTFSRNYYSDLHPNVYKTEKITDLDLNREISMYPNEIFIKDILQGLFKANFFNDKNIFKSDIELMSENFKEYIHSIL